MKKYLISAIVSSQLLFSTGIPVVDVVSNVQALTQNIKEIAEWAQYAQRWSETAQHYQNQLKAYEDQLLSATEIRDSVQFMKDLERLRKYSQSYGDDYLDLAQAMANPNSRIGNLSKSLFERYNVFDRCENDIYKDWEKENCKMKLQREVTQIATVHESNELVNETAENLEALAKKAANAQDIKESQDLANAINIEMANLQVVSMRMDMLNKQNEAQARAEEEQKKRKQAMLRVNGQGTHLLNVE